MEGALLIPKTHLSLREAVIRLAERRTPQAGVRRYLEYLEADHEAVWQAIMASIGWPGTANTTVAAPPSPALGALEAARNELRQALGDADLIAVLLSIGGLVPAKSERWRGYEGFEAFQSERLDGGRVLLGELDFARWMAGDAPTVAAEADETTQAQATESHYPAVGDIPEHRHLTACEVLTWIGYGRAISKDVYFAPRASGLPAEERDSLLHRSVPDPKPPDDPMDDAERKLMEAVRAGLVHMLTVRNGAFEEMQAAIYEHAVVVTARGSIEADWRASERDRERAITYRSSLPPIGDVWFRKSEVLEAWPTNVSDGGLPHPRPVGFSEATSTSLNKTLQANPTSNTPVGEPMSEQVGEQEASTPKAEPVPSPPTDREFIDLKSEPPRLPRYTIKSTLPRATKEQVDECINKIAELDGGKTNRRMIRDWGRYWLRTRRLNPRNAGLTRGF